jgi:hypothetical protein
MTVLRLKLAFICLSWIKSDLFNLLRKLCNQFENDSRIDGGEWVLIKFKSVEGEVVCVKCRVLCTK